MIYATALGRMGDINIIPGKDESQARMKRKEGEEGNQIPNKKDSHRPRSISSAGRAKEEVLEMVSSSQGAGQVGLFCRDKVASCIVIEVETTKLALLNRDDLLRLVAACGCTVWMAFLGQVSVCPSLVLWIPVRQLNR